MGIVTGPKDVISAGRPDDLPIAHLRGAGVDGSPRRAALAVAVVVFAGILAAGAILLVAAVEKNAQVNDLRQHGVEVAVTVTACRGLLGGSGSNAAGETCLGRYTLGGHSYVETLPGSVPSVPGRVLRGVVARDDPTLLSTPAVLETEHTSWRPYLAPVVLILADLALAAAVVAVHRRAARRDAAQTGGV